MGSHIDGVEGAAANREAAEATRHFGALAFLENPEEALLWYRQTVEFGPANAEGWIQLGHIYRTGQLDQAEDAYRKAVTLGKANGDKETIARGTRTLGLIYETRGEHARAEAMFKKSLALFKEIGAAPRVKEVQTSLDTLNKSSRER